jgi:predicted nucleotidyltransferase
MLVLEEAAPPVENQCPTPTTLPDLTWVRKELFRRFRQPLNRRKWRLVAAWVVGSVAKGTAGPASDLDIAVVVERTSGKPPRHSSIKQTELFHQIYRSNEEMPVWADPVSGRQWRVDFQFFWPTDEGLEGYARIALTGRSSRLRK